ncbi:glycoside hydrolase [Leptolyngbya sp. FACHB-261]|uniref:glycoside hydrolase n=1 Tax=Leptolyngbya sp. FACHB-261 TaxID=2692806 RepID=UPI001688DC44|nr:glycoside hydrolase [Leptolyngbya sp. FACHB-261]MBD2104919.1 glycoside hydrolase [Leptolyngbya sp. FACHB-261]
MPHPLYVAFIWHQHQPLYKSPVAGKYRLPWVRLHGTKDYLDLILILERYPALHQTVNLVPSLLRQLEDYVQGTAFDPYLELLLSPIESLDPQKQQFIVEHFFDANHHTLIDPHPRYAELYNQRQSHGHQWCLENWTKTEYGDLLAWHNLAWIDPIFWDDPEVEQWLRQDRNFSNSDRQRIYSKQREILSRIIPQHRKMQESGQLELTTTPYTHPILPLLADTEAARVALPNLPLPRNRFTWEQDIPLHLTKGVEVYQQHFGRQPRGLWPSEQSVSPAILPYVAKAGFNWLCSDEGVLSWSLQHLFRRDDHGNVLDPELLYRPYRVETAAGDLAMVFRDHRLSDLIGFSYGPMQPTVAAQDFIGHLESIANSLKTRQPGGGTALAQPWLVTIALDGENCWEYYERDGLPFLEALYSRLSEHSELKLVTVSEFLEEFPPTAILAAQQLHSGSWIDANFTTWIGAPVKNLAWELLTEARRVLANHPEATLENNPEVWEALLAAEGSDWFWWFGEGHSSNQDAMFDQLFREHLIALYRALNEPVPSSLLGDLEIHDGPGDHLPRGFIHPYIDGLGDEQDWDRAGRIDLGGARGAMHQASAIQRLWYGVDHFNFYLRLDFRSGLTPGVDTPSQLHLFWFYPGRIHHNSPAPLANLPDQAPLNYFFHHHLLIDLKTQTVRFMQAREYYHWEQRTNNVQLGLNQCLEVAIPWSDLGIEPSCPLRLVAMLAQDGCFQAALLDKALLPIEAP